MEERVEKIEGKLALAEDMLDELNKTVYRQQMQIEQLQRAVIKLQAQAEAQEAAQSQEARNPNDEVPPHY